MNIILFDTHWNTLHPLTYTRPVADLRMGILTLREKWEHYLQGKASFRTQDYLSGKFPEVITNTNYLINANILANAQLAKAISALTLNETLESNGELLATCLNTEDTKNFTTDKCKALNPTLFKGEYTKIQFPEDIFTFNAQEIKADFQLLTTGRASEGINNTNRVINPENIFIEAGAKISCATLNAEDGPIYIGANAVVMEGALIRGPFALCENATVKMGAKVYEGSTFGPHCKVAGETSNVVFHGYSSKAHDGFLGNAVLGEWCNIGADTNNSNLKNDYTKVKIWDYPTERFRNTQLQFCGTIMGDHTKIGINTMLNTGTVIGVNANIFGGGFPRQFIPSFAWGGAGGFKEYQFKKALKTADLVMQRRHKEVTTQDEAILQKVFELDAKFRNF